MNSEELLLEQARLYIRLSGDPGSDPEQVEGCIPSSVSPIIESRLKPKKPFP